MSLQRRISKGVGKRSKCREIDVAVERSSATDDSDGLRFARSASRAQASASQVASRNSRRARRETYLRFLRRRPSTSRSPGARVTILRLAKTSAASQHAARLSLMSPFAVAVSNPFLLFAFAFLAAALALWSGGLRIANRCQYKSRRASGACSCFVRDHIVCIRANIDSVRREVFQRTGAISQKRNLIRKCFRSLIAIEEAVLVGFQNLCITLLPPRPGLPFFVSPAARGLRQRLLSTER